MAVKNVGTLIKEARTAKNLSQEKLAGAIEGLSASDLSKAERGEKELTQSQLKAIAKATGVTQKSLLEAPKGGTSIGANASKKTTAATSTTAKKTETRKTSSAGTAKTASASKTVSSSEKLTVTEKKVLELYRSAEADNKKLAVRILKGEKLELSDILPMLMSSGTVGEDGLLGGLLGKVQNLMK